MYFEVHFISKMLEPNYLSWPISMLIDRNGLEREKVRIGKT